MNIDLHRQCAPGSSLYHEWKSLAKSPLEDPDWLLSWWRTYQDERPSRELALVTLRDGDQLIGLAPFYTERGRLRLLGDGDVCTDHQELVIVRSGQDKVAIRNLATWLFEGCPADLWSSIQLKCIDVDGPTDQLFRSWRATGFCPVFVAEDTGNCCLDLAPSWDEFLASLSKNHRKRCRRWHRKYFESGLVEYVATDKGWDRTEAQRALFDLHKRRRASLGDPSVFDDRRFAEFHQHSFQVMADAGLARVSGIRLKSQLVAVEYELVGSDTIFSYQSGIDPDAMEHSPGSLSIMASIQRAIRDGKSHLDLMRGTEEYKSHWNARPKSTHHVKCWRHGVSGHLAMSSNVLWHNSKELLRDLVR